MTGNDRIGERLAARFARTASPTPWNVILYGGLGDHVMWLSLLAAFRQQAKAPVIVACDPRIADLARLYADRAFDTLIELDRLTSEEIEYLTRHARLAPGTPVMAWHPPFIGDETAYFANSDAAMTAVVRQVLGLPADAPVCPPHISGSAHLAARWDMTRLGLPIGRTVLLAPWAKSARVMLSPAWWAELAGMLVRQGYTVVTNTAMRSRGFDARQVDDPPAALPGTRAVDIPLRHIIPFADLCGTIVMARSGLSDLLAFSRARSWVVWPHAAGQEIYFRKLFRIWSLQRLYPCQQVTEVHQDAAAPFDPGPLMEWLRASPHASPPGRTGL
jgi:hypothetical protein